MTIPVFAFELTGEIHLLSQMLKYQVELNKIPCLMIFFNKRLLFVCLCGCSQHLQASMAQDEDIHQSQFLKCIRENIIEHFFYFIREKERFCCWEKWLWFSTGTKLATAQTLVQLRRPLPQSHTASSRGTESHCSSSLLPKWVST